MSIESLHNMAMAALPERYDKAIGTVQSDILKAAAILADDTQQINKDLLNNMIYDTASEEWKEKIAYDRCVIERKQAVSASGNCRVKGDAGVQVAAGEKVATDTMTFTITKGCAIDTDGTGTIEVICDVEGSVGNVPVGAISSFPVTISGVYEVKNEHAFTNGYDKESIEELDKRYYAKRKNPGTSGNKHHYRIWALEVTGVGDCRVLPRVPDRGTVTVVIIDSNKMPASESLVMDCKTYIEEQKPVSADVVVKSAEEVTVDIVVTVAAEKDYTEEIKEAVRAYLQDIAFNQTYVSYAQIGEKILSIEGVKDYQNLKINGGTANITIPDTSVAVVGGVTVV